MRSREIESWSLRIIENVGAGRPNEDFLVELKATIIRVSASTKTPERSEYASTVRVNVNVLPIAVENPIPLDAVLSRVNPIPNAVFMWTLAGANPPWEKRTLPTFI